MIIGIDVDLTVVDTLNEWLKWYEDKTNHKLDISSYNGHNLQSLMNKVEDPMAFWDDPCLYDNLLPKEDAEYYIKKLMEEYEIVFISAVFGNHFWSKKQFIDRHFPGTYFVATDKKWLVNVDILIDDNLEYCNEFYENTNKPALCLGTDINNSDLTWEHIYNIIKEKRW